MIVWKLSNIFKADPEACYKEIHEIGDEISPEQIVNIINLAGFGLGIGSGRTSGYGRYHVDGVFAL